MISLAKKLFAVKTSPKQDQPSTPPANSPSSSAITLEAAPLDTCITFKAPKTPLRQRHRPSIPPTLTSPPTTPLTPPKPDAAISTQFKLRPENPTQLPQDILTLIYNYLSQHEILTLRKLNRASVNSIANYIAELQKTSPLRKFTLTPTEFDEVNYIIATDDCILSLRNKRIEPSIIISTIQHTQDFLRFYMVWLAGKLTYNYVVNQALLISTLKLLIHLSIYNTLLWLIHKAYVDLYIFFLYDKLEQHNRLIKSLSTKEEDYPLTNAQTLRSWWFTQGLLSEWSKEDQQTPALSRNIQQVALYSYYHGYPPLTRQETRIVTYLNEVHLTNRQLITFLNEKFSGLPLTIPVKLSGIFLTMPLNLNVTQLSPLDNIVANVVKEQPFTQLAVDVDYLTVLMMIIIDEQPPYRNHLLENLLVAENSTFINLSEFERKFITRFILRYYYSPNHTSRTRQAASGQTLLHFAVKEKDLMLLEILLRSGADPTTNPANSNPRYNLADQALLEQLTPLALAKNLVADDPTELNRQIKEMLESYRPSAPG